MHEHDAVKRGWIGVDLDGTLAHYEGWKGAAHIGEPVGEMLFRVKKWLADGWEVRILTARCWPLLQVSPGDSLMNAARLWAPRERVLEAEAAIQAIQAWCTQHLGQPLCVTCVKDYRMVELWDDRAVQVEPNTGRLIGASTRGL